MPPRRSHGPQVLVITGLSGSGKTLVSRALEDIGWFCVDNLPTALIPRFVDLLRESHDLRRAALVVDMRERDFVKRFPRVFREVRKKGVDASLLFLEADEKVLLRRFSETRRPHPLAVNQPAIEGIREERESLGPIRQEADLILDTSEYTVHELRDYIRDHYDLRSEASPIVVSVMSFGYKYGLPSEADLVFDVRFLPNPELRPQAETPHRQRIGPWFDSCRGSPRRGIFLRRVTSFLRFVIPRYVAEGKSYLSIAVGCTGGRHRSVMIANALGEALLPRAHYAVRVRHRDMRLQRDRHRRRDPRAAGGGAGERRADHRGRDPGHRGGLHRLDATTWPARGKPSARDGRCGGRRRAHPHRHVRGHPDQREPAFLSPNGWRS